MNFEDKLISAVTQYDELQSRKKSWNPRALGIYITRANEIASDVRRGAGQREAIIAGFTGSILSYVLRKMKLSPATRDEFTGAGKMLYRPVRGNPPFYAHNLYEKKTHGLNLKQMRRLYAMVSRGNQKAITYARNVLGIPFSESPTQVKAVVYHHVRDLAERRVRRNPARSHRERIAIDTVRHPMKGYFLGGPDLAESVRYLRSLGYSMAQLKKLNPEVEDILEGRKSILPNRRVKRNPFGGETLRSFRIPEKQRYKGFQIIVEFQPNTILATWTNGDILESDRFSGYELNEVLEEVKARIDALKRRRK